jgi:hypothetical protein
MTQSVMQGTHSAYRQSIMPWQRSNLFLMLKFMKLVSRRTRYGGPSAVLYLKNMLVGAWSLPRGQPRDTVDAMIGGDVPVVVAALRRVQGACVRTKSLSGKVA